MGSKMSFVTYAERVGLEMGLEPGRRIALQALDLVLAARDGDAGREFVAELHHHKGADTLQAVIAAIKTGSNLDDLWKLLPARGKAAG